MKRDPGRGGEEFSFGFEKENVVEGEERLERGSENRTIFRNVPWENFDGTDFH